MGRVIQAEEVVVVQSQIKILFFFWKKSLTSLCISPSCNQRRHLTAWKKIHTEERNNSDEDISNLLDVYGETSIYSFYLIYLTVMHMKLLLLFLNACSSRSIYLIMVQLSYEKIWFFLFCSHFNNKTTSDSLGGMKKISDLSPLQHVTWTWSSQNLLILLYL